MIWKSSIHPKIGHGFDSENTCQYGHGSNRGFRQRNEPIWDPNVFMDSLFFYLLHFEVHQRCFLQIKSASKMVWLPFDLVLAVTKWYTYGCKMLKLSRQQYMRIWHWKSHWKFQPHWKALQKIITLKFSLLQHWNLSHIVIQECWSLIIPLITFSVISFVLSNFSVTLVQCDFQCHILLVITFNPHSK